MANNCYNHIRIEGPKEEITKFENFFNQAIDKQYESLDFEILLGYDPYKNKDVYEEVGTKWFIPDVEQYNENEIVISGDSAWSPPIELFRKLSEKFKVQIEHTYEELGCDFGGIAEIENGNLQDSCYSYWEWKFIDDYSFAVERAFEDELEYIAEYAEDEEELKKFDGYQYMEEEEQNEWIEKGLAIIKDRQPVV